jgi:hypothetical protein
LTNLICKHPAEFFPICPFLENIFAPVFPDPGYKVLLFFSIKESAEEERKWASQMTGLK